jgi:hypothetical protein
MMMRERKKAEEANQGGPWQAVREFERETKKQKVATAHTRLSACFSLSFFFSFFFSRQINSPCASLKLSPWVSKTEEPS